MRRIDALAIALGFFLTGGLVYGLLQATGMEATQAGIYAQAVLVGGLVLWLLSYLFRVFSNDMTYHQQLKDYEEKLVERRWAEMTPAEREKVQAEVEQERQASQADGP